MAAKPKQAGLHAPTKTVVWETPKDYFETLDAEFRVELDACALPSNAKCHWSSKSDTSSW